jgi:hypothetical protein
MQADNQTAPEAEAPVENPEIAKENATPEAAAELDPWEQLEAEAAKWKDLSLRTAAGWVYRNIDQRVVDGAVRGAGDAAQGAGSALRPVQSGKVNQYGALLFGATAIGALVLVIINT